MRTWLRKLASMQDRRRLDAELDEEIRTHLEMAEEELVRRGMPVEDARRAARRSFGGVERARERHREARGFPWLDDLARDLRLATRTLLMDRGFTATVVVTLAVAIGANTAIFSVVDAVLLQPLPYPDSERIVTVGLDRPNGSRLQQAFSDAGYRLFREENESFFEVGAYRTESHPLTGSGEPMQATVARLNGRAFTVLGASPRLGRLPADDEDAPGGRRVALLSHALWTERYASDPDALGRSIELNDTLRVVIGVMPPEFAFPSRETDVWIPLQMDSASGNVLLFPYNLIARLRPDATLVTATEDAQELFQRLPEVGHPPGVLTTILASRANIMTLKERMVGESRRVLLLILGAVSVVLLIAVLNVASLFIVRAEARAQQRAVRAALGASRARLARHALGESLLLAFAGGVGGLVVAYAGRRALVGLSPVGIPRLEGVGIGPAVLAYTAGASLLAGLFFALLPALAARGGEGLASGLWAAGRGVTVGRERLRLRAALVTAEVALAVVLLIGSVLMTRSLEALRSVDPGFDPSDLTTFGLVLPAPRYGSTQAADLYDALVAALRAQPDIESAAVTTGLPVVALGASYRLVIEDAPDAPDVFAVRWVTPGYFETMGIPVLEGRTMLPEDGRVFRAFISESFAEQYWSGTSSIGRRIGPGATVAEIVGVVGDVHVRALDVPPEAAVYAPMGAPGSPSIRSVSVVIRSSAADLAPVLRREVRALDSELPLIDIRSMESVVATSPAVSRTSFVMLLLVVSAMLALLLGAVGIYGVIAYMVSRRTPEIGVRVALGATSGDIWSRVVARSFLPALVGIALGLGVAALGSRVLTSLLFQTSPLDATAFVAGPAAFLLVAAAACVVPARRAMKIDPVRALRCE